MTNRQLEILFKVENRQVAKLAKSSSSSHYYYYYHCYYYYFPDKSLFCLLNHHYDSSTIPITFIVKLWSTSIEMISPESMEKRVSTTPEIISLREDAIVD